MDLVEVVRPVDDRRVEAERPPIGVVDPLPQQQQPVDPEAGFGLGVRAVQLDVAERPLGLLSSLFEM